MKPAPLVVFEAIMSVQAHRRARRITSPSDKSMTSRPEWRRGAGSTQRAEERPHLAREGFRLLEGGEVAARGHRRPAADVEDALGPRARRAHDLTWKRGVAHRHLDAGPV